VLALTTVGLAAGPGATPAVASALPEFRSCAQLRDWYVREALRVVTPWGLMAGGPIPMFAERSAVVPASAGAAANGPTGTNVQEAGVDEPDIAKTDGRIAVTVDGRRLRVYDVTGSSSRELSSVSRLFAWRSMYASTSPTKMSAHSASGASCCASHAASAVSERTSSAYVAALAS